MRPKFDDLLSALIGELDYNCDRYDPDWPDLYSVIVTDSMLRAFEVLRLAKRIRDEAGQVKWHATPDLRRLARGRIKTHDERAD